MKKFFTLLASVCVALSAMAQEPVLTLKAVPVSGYVLDPAVTSNFVEYDDRVVIEAFDGVAGNDLSFTWDNNGWNAVNGEAVPTVTINNSDKYVKATLVVSSISGTWNAAGGSFWVSVTAYANADDVTGTQTYLYWNLLADKEPGKLVKTLNVTYTDYITDSKTYNTFVTDGIVSGYQTTIDVYDNGEYVIKNWLQQEGYDVTLTANDGYFSAANGVAGVSASVAYGDGKTAWIYLGSNSWYSKEWIFLSCYIGSGYASCYYHIDSVTAIESIESVEAPAAAPAARKTTDGIFVGGRRYNYAGQLVR